METVNTQNKVKEVFNKKNIMANTSWLFFEKILRMVTGLLVGVWVARYLGPSNYGVVNYSLAIIEIMAAVVALGLDSVVVRYLVNKSGKVETILGTAFYLKLGSSLLVVFINIFVFFNNAMGAKQELLMILILSLGLIFQSFNVIDYYFQSFIRSKAIVISRSIAFFVSSFLKLTFVIFNFPLIYFGVAIIMESFLIAILFVIVYKINGGRVYKFEFSINKAKEMIGNSWPLILSNLAIILYMRVDQIMLGRMVNQYEVGIYSAAVKISEMFYFVPTAIMTSLFPVIVKNIKSNINVEGYMANIYNLMSIIGYGVAIPVAIFSSEFIQILYGVKYSESSSILAIYVWIGIFVNLGVARSSYLKAKNENRILLYSSIIGCGINIFLNLIFIPKYGAVGAAYASAISYWVQAHGVCYLFPNMRRSANMMSKSLIVPFILIIAPKKTFSILKRIVKK